MTPGPPSPASATRSSVPTPGLPSVRRAEETLVNPGDLHDPEAVSAAYLVSARMMQL